MNSPLNFYQICYESKCKDEIIFIAFELIKSVIATYIVIRLKHFAKEENDCIKKTRSRAKLSKLIIFHGQ